MTKHVRVSSSRKTFPVISLLLFGLAGAAACSGSDTPKAPAPTAAPDGGAPRAGSASALATVREVGAERSALRHLSPESASALREHGGLLFRKRLDSGVASVLDAAFPKKYGEAVRAWPIGKEALAIALRPLVGGTPEAEITEDGHAVYKDVYGHADIVQSLDDTTLHQTIILRDAQSPEYMNWELVLRDAKVRPVEIDGGAIVLVDSTNVGRLKISAVSIVGADGSERKASFSLVGNDLGLHIDQRGLTYPAAVTFGVSAPAAGEQFAIAPVQIKGRVMVILDTSGSMIWQFGSDTTSVGQNTYQGCTAGNQCTSNNCNANRCTCGGGNPNGQCNGGYTCQGGFCRGGGADGDGRAVYCDNNVGTAFNCGLANQACTTANGGMPDWRLANAVTGPSRMFAAKEALTNVVTAHAGLLDFGLERYAADGACPNTTYCCTPPTDATTQGRCQGHGFYHDPWITINNDLTYGGACGTVTAGGRVLVQPGATSGAAVLPWVDHVENFCDDGTAKPRNPELRGDGATPLGRSIQTALSAWYQPVYQVSKAAPNPSDPLYDSLIDCRPYVLVVMTDGDDTCSAGSETCTDDNQCPSNDCGNNTCDCNGNAQCPGGATCNNGNCTGYFAQRCAVNGDCGSNTCTMTRCTCTMDSQCATGYRCLSGICREKAPSQHVSTLRGVSATNPVTVYTLGMGNALGLNTTELDAMQVAGGSGQTIAPIAANQTEIEAAFADIVSRTVKFEVCNGLDDNCNVFVDEGLGVYQECAVNADCDGAPSTCNAGRCTCTTNAHCAAGNSCAAGFCRPACSVGVGTCLRNGVRKCGAGAGQCCVNDGSATCTVLTAGAPGNEICNGLDDNCNGIIDDVAGGCPICPILPETCNGLDDDCDGTIDNNLVDTGKVCGSDVGICSTGLTACVTVSGTKQLVCQGGNGGLLTDPCNGLDDNCDTVVDGNTQACYTCGAGIQDVGICRGGTQQCTAVLGSGVPAFGTCIGQTCPAAETCNGLDDNCNNVIDDVAGLGASCCPGGSCGVGICRAGTQQCSGGTLQCIGAVSPGTEVCNGIDDNCNNVIDDVAGVGSSCCPSGNCGTGVCRAGTLACSGNALVCQNAVGPSTEICDGIDNDCNGQVDDLPGRGQTCCPPGVSCGVGLCRSGTLQCATGSQQLQCRGATGPVAEICNGEDDNCNGIVDDVPNSGTSCCTSGLCGTGICTTGVRQCVGTTLTCVGETTPGTETCNNVDDNCNGTVDDVPGLGTNCCAYQDSAGNNLCAVGLCTNGALACRAGNATPVCVGGTGPVTEICNGFDDNCDGTVDNLPGGTVGQACCPSGKCGTGICRAGALACGSNGLLVCQGAVNPAAEVCNGEDDNCNGIVDDVPGAGQACCPPGVPCGTGICRAGTLQCASGSQQLQCRGFIDKDTEVCNGLDDDCNGLVDDVPGSGTSCCTSNKCGTGTCKTGVQRCVGNALTCTGEDLPGTEICDDQDNDCNDIVDDVPGVGDVCCGFHDGAGADLCGVGICTTGTLQCVPGQTTTRCTGGVGPATELCDGIDNDCNGVVDNLPGGVVGGTCCPSGKCGIGICTSGHLQCGPRGIECADAQNPEGEVCDGLDNDCNDVVDDVPGLDTTCCPSGRCGTGVCKSGLFKCNDSGGSFSLKCEGSNDASDEVCDGLDNDCNGIVDDVPGLGAPCCPAGSPGTNAPDDCNKGVCRPGVLKCDVPNQTFMCDGGHGRDPNLCNGRDDNCDGAVDETAEIADDPAIGVECNVPVAPADHLPCAPGHTICQGAQAVCTDDVGPGPEKCDGVDQDCDGLIDNEAPCPPDKVCLQGGCRSRCERGDIGSRCPGGESCVSGFCLPIGGPGAGGGGNVGGNAGQGGDGQGGAGSGEGGTGSGEGGTGSGEGGTGSGEGGTGSGEGGGTGVGADGGVIGPDAGAGNTSGGGRSSGTGASTGKAGGSGPDPDRDVFGLATGGGGCACRTGVGTSSGARGLSLLALLAAGVIGRRRNRRAA